MDIKILTLFPEMFTAMEQSILGRAQAKGIINIETINFRDYSENKHKKVDDYSFGGGQGMVLAYQPIDSCLEDIGAAGKTILYMSPRGRILDQEKLKELAEKDQLIILCGHYEGVDQRVIDKWQMEEVSIGDYVLTGGELPAMVLTDSLSRLIPGVLSGESSIYDESVYSGLLEYPQYTKPRITDNLEVPDVLLSGNHQEIAKWRFEQALVLTRERRPDLFEKFLEKPQALSKEEEKVLAKVLEML